jgi:hypothetical protein
MPPIYLVVGGLWIAAVAIDIVAVRILSETAARNAPTV